MMKFLKAEEERLLLKISKNRRQSWIRDTIRHNEFVVNILEGAIFGKKAMGRPRLQHLKQVARNTRADRYTAMNRMAFSNSRWKAANQSNDSGIRRRLPHIYSMIISRFCAVKLRPFHAVHIAFLTG
jgi:allophanate hydrolase subunit 2